MVYLKRTFLEGRVVHDLFPVSLIGKQRAHSHGYTNVFLPGIHFSDQWNKCQLHVICNGSWSSHVAGHASATVMVTIHIEILSHYEELSL